MSKQLSDLSLSIYEDPYKRKSLCLWLGFAECYEAAEIARLVTDRLGLSSSR